MNDVIREEISRIRKILQRIDGEIYTLSIILDEIEMFLRNQNADGSRRFDVLSNLLNDLKLTLGNHSTENKCCDQKIQKEE